MTVKDDIRDHIHPVLHRIRLWNQRRIYGDWYTRGHDDHDVDRHLTEAVDWLCRAQDTGSDRGFAYGVSMGRGYAASYPETTGYIIPTLLRLARLWNRRELRERAIEAGDWEIAVQMDCGATMGGRVNVPPTPALFNTGQVLLGWASLLAETGEQRYLNAGLRAAEWMIEMQDPNGNWTRGNSEFAKPDSTLYNVRAAWGLGFFGHVVESQAYLDAASRNGDYALTRQQPNGWYANNCLSDPTRPLTHTIAYTMRGLFELGILLDRDDFTDSARRCADGLMDAIGPEGFLSGCIDSNFRGTVNWCCLSGSAQVSIVLWMLSSWTGEERYAAVARRLNRYVMSRHDIDHPNPAIRGGLAGSWPIWGEYGQFSILNWAVKFLVDGLLEEKLAAGAFADLGVARG